jgi:ketosteroid isomerase-like protein
MASIDPVADVKRAMDAYGAAYSANRVDALRGLRHPNFVFISSRGELVHNERELQSIAAGESRVDSSKFSMAEVTVVDRTAIITGDLRLEGVWQDRPYALDLALTATWILTESGWRILAEHASGVSG